MQGTDIAGLGHYYINGDYLKSVRDFALSQGVSPTALTAASGLTLAQILNPSAKIGHLSMVRVGENLVNSLPQPLHSAFVYSRHLANNYHGLLGVAAMEALSLEQAVHLMAQYLTLRSSFNKIDIVKEDALLKLRMTTADEHLQRADLTKLFFELALLLNLEHLGRLFLAPYQLEEGVRINVATPEPDGFPYDLIGPNTELVFGQAYFELCIPLAWAELKIQGANSELIEQAKSILEQELMQLSPSDLASAVAQIIRESRFVLPSLVSVAKELHMSPSTLQRRLRGLSVSFSEIKDKELKLRAQHLLADDSKSIEGISDELGFNNASNFAKAFKVWLGLNPKQYRLKQSKEKTS